MAPHSKAETTRTTFTAAGLAIHIDLHEGRDVSQLFVAAAHSKSLAGHGLSLSPAELVRRSLENRAQPFVLEVLHAELQRIHLQSMRQFVHVRLAGKMVGRSGERAVRPLPQRRMRAG